MKCKVCGAELKGNGEICTKCFNKQQKEKELAKDTELLYELNPTFKPIHELGRLGDALIVAIIIIVVVTMNYGALAFGLLIVLYFFMAAAWFRHRRKVVKATSCKFYENKILYKDNKKKKVFTYRDVKDITCYQTTFETLFSKFGDITISTNELFEKITINDIANAREEMNQIKTICNKDRV